MLTLLTGRRAERRRARDRHGRVAERAGADRGILVDRPIAYTGATVVSRSVLPVAVATAMLCAQYHPHVAAQMAAGVPLLLGPKEYLARTYEDLSSMIKADPDQPESQPWVMFDTQQYPQAGVSTATGSLSFFNNANAANNSDPTLSNFPTGTLQADYYFEVHRVHTMIHAVPAGTAGATVTVTGPANDVEILHKTARGIVSATLRGKNYLGYPLFYFGRPGGPVPSYMAYGSGTSADNKISTGETEANGGFPVLGNIVVPPVNQFIGSMTFVPSTAISAPTNIVYAIMGVLHRPIA